MMNRVCTFVCLLLAVPALASAPYFYDVQWFNQVDNDGDGFYQRFDLGCDVDMTDTGIVYVKTYYRPAGTSSGWTLWSTTAPFAVNGTETRYELIPIDPCPHAFRDYQLELYDANTNQLVETLGPDYSEALGYHAEELASEDVFATASDPRIGDAYWSGAIDIDGDAFVRSDSLHFGVEVAQGSTTVVVDTYKKFSGSMQWGSTPFATTAPIVVTATETNHSSLYVPGDANGTYDYLLLVRRVGETAVAAMYGPSEDSAMASHSEELDSEDTKISTTDAYWIDRVDLDGDGYSRSATLAFDPDAVGTAQLYATVLCRPSGTTNWLACDSVSDFSIYGTATDTIRAAMQGKERGAYDYQINLYSTLTHELLQSYGPSDDTDLVAHKEEPALEDAPTLVGSMPKMHLVNSLSCASGRVRFELKHSDNVRVALYGLDGRLALTLFDAETGPGVHAVSVGRRVSRGATYILSIRSRGYNESKRVILRY